MKVDIGCILKISVSDICLEHLEIAQTSKDPIYAWFSPSTKSHFSWLDIFVTLREELVQTY